MDWQKLYQARLTTVDQAVKHIKSGSRILLHDTIAHPKFLVDAMVRNREQYRDIEFTHMFGLEPHEEYMDPGMEPYFRENSFMLNKPSRQAFYEGRADFSVSHYGQLPNMYRRFKPLDAALVQVSPPDDQGYVSFGGSVNYSKPGAECAKMVIAQVNNNVPYTYGDSLMHVSQIDWFVEHDSLLYEFPQGIINDVSLKIGRFCAQLIEDRSCLQLGMGSIPDAVLACLEDKKDLGIFSELFSDGVVELYKKGIINSKYAGVHPGKLVAASLNGSRALYAWGDRNPDLEMHPIDYTNNPVRIARNERMVSINGCAAVDLYGQVVAEHFNGRQFTGIGGQLDYIRGAAMSKGGKSILAMPSATKNNTISKIVTVHPEGAVITTPRSDVDYIVTEFGYAHLKGKTNRERARLLINIAHPDFREQLTREYEQRNHVRL
jgi:4-hydroxybutyrate CoA-transferase